MDVGLGVVNNVSLIRFRRGLSANLITDLKKPVIALLMPLAIQPATPPVPSPSGTWAGGMVPAVGTGEAVVVVPGWGTQSGPEHDDGGADAVGVGRLGVVAVGAGPGLGLGSA